MSADYPKPYRKEGALHRGRPRKWRPRKSWRHSIRELTDNTLCCTSVIIGTAGELWLSVGGGVIAYDAWATWKWHDVVRILRSQRSLWLSVAIWHNLSCPMFKLNNEMASKQAFCDNVAQLVRLKTTNFQRTRKTWSDGPCLHVAFQISCIRVTNF